MKAVTLAAALLLIPAPALAWHVDPAPGEVTPRTTLTVTRHGPRGDPLYRIVVRASRGPLPTCRGTVTVPDEPWAEGTTLTVDGTAIAIGRGETARIAPGEHVGRWSNDDEIERFTVPPCRVNAAKPAKVTWRIVAAGEARRLTRTLAPGCTWRSGWRWLDASSRSWVSRDGRRLASWRAAPLGDYGTPPPVRVGVTCRP